MRQQEANQFDKGLNLDTNPIGLDNHTLTGALNATMITRNGNELVLQNDMGNAKVESAALRSGFVPVGMQEYGGIVYVASYNPFTQESEIGSFPSPERNISGDETGAPETKLGTLIDNLDNENFKISKNYYRNLLINGPLRPGDKFVIKEVASDDNNFPNSVEKNYISVRAIVVDSDGNNIDITDDLKTYTADSGTVKWMLSSTAEDLSKEDDDRWQIYKGKIPGSLYLVEKLNLPDSVSVKVTGSRGNDEKVSITISPEAKNANGTNYDGKWRFCNEDWEKDEVEEKCYSFEAEEKTYTFDIYPQLPYGYIDSLKQTISFDASKIATGEITFDSFRYYNNMSNSDTSTDLEYRISAYLNEDQNISAELVYIDYADLKTANGNINKVTNIQRMSIPAENGIVNYTHSIPHDTVFQSGHIYLARIEATVKDVTKSEYNETSHYSDYYWIITGSITNDYYINNPEKDMFPSSSNVSISLNWKVNWKVTEDDSQYKDVAGETDTETFPTTNITHIQKSIVRNGSITRTYTPEIIIDEGKQFPFTSSTTQNITTNWGNNKYNIDFTIKKSPSGKTDLGLNPKSDQKIDSTNEEPTTNTIVGSNTLTGDNIKVTLKYNLTSKFIASTTTEPQKYVLNGVGALVPYMTTYVESDKYRNQLKSVLGEEPHYGKAQNGGYWFQPGKWFHFKLWKRGNGNRARQMGVLSCGSNYNNENPYNDPSDFKTDLPNNQGEGDDNGSYTTYDTNTDALWSNYMNYFLAYLNTNLAIYPKIYFWQGGNSEHCELTPNGDTATKAYSIPMMMGTNGQMYILNQCQYHTTEHPWNGGASYGHPLKNIITDFSHIYCYQPNQNVSFDYYRTNDDDYAYTDPYQATANVTVSIDKTPSLTLKYNDVEYDSSASLNNFKLPTFKLADSENASYSETIIIDAPDNSEQVSECLNVKEPTVGNVAIYTTGDGLKPTTTDIIWAPKDGTEFNTSHSYYLNSNKELIDCENETIETIEDNNNEKPGLLIAKAIHKGQLVLKSDVNLDGLNTYQVVPAAINCATDLQTTIGNKEKDTPLSSVVTNHVLDLHLFRNLVEIT